MQIPRAIPELLSSICLLVELPSHPRRLSTLICICHTTRRRAHCPPPHLPNQVSESQSGDSTTYDVYQSPGTCTVSQTTRGTSEKYECAGRGICDHDSGTCDCFQGYHGFDCGAISPVV